MAKYFYDKYTSIADYYYDYITVNKPPSVSYELSLNIGIRSDVSNSPTTFSLSPTTGSFSTPSFNTNQLNNIFYKLGAVSNSIVVECEKTQPWSSSTGYFKEIRTVKEAQLITSYRRGTYIEQVIAENGTYPLDGRHSNGYWYVRRGLAFPEFNMKINGVLKVSENGWVRINGTLREIDTIQTRVNGSLKEV